MLIVQDDHFNATGSITICLLTTQPIDASLFRIAIEPTADNGLREPCFAMADKITTMARERLGNRLGALKPIAMAPINQAMLVILELAGRGRR